MEVISLNLEVPENGLITLTLDITNRIADVLNNVCEKFKLNTEDYILRYRREVLPHEKVLKESGLPPGAHLLLCPTASPPAKPVTVDLITGGSVSSKVFKSTDSLWDVYRKFGKQRHFPDESVQMSFLGHTLIGNNILKATKLSSLPHFQNTVTLELERNISSVSRHISVATLATEGEKLTSTSNLSYKSRKNFDKLPSVTEVEDKIPPKETNDKDQKDYQQEIISGKKGSEIGSKGEVAVVPFIIPKKPKLLRGISVVDSNYYTSGKKKLRGIGYLDERKGLTYSLRNKTIFGKAGMVLLGLEEDESRGSLSVSEERQSLKIVFPQESVIRASFKRHETVEDVLSFVSSVTETSDFILCTKDSEGFCDLNKSTLIKNLNCDPPGTLFVKYKADFWKNKPDPVFKNHLVPKLSVAPQKEKVWKFNSPTVSSSATKENPVLKNP